MAVRAGWAVPRVPAVRVVMVVPRGCYQPFPPVAPVVRAVLVAVRAVRAAAVVERVWFWVMAVPAGWVVTGSGPALMVVVVVMADRPGCYRCGVPAVPAVPVVMGRMGIAAPMV